MRIRAAIFLLMIAPVATAQIVVSEGTQATAAANTQVNITTGGDLINNSSAFNFSSANLFLSMNGTDQNIEGAWSVSNLDLSGTSFNLNGSLTVSTGITFNSGILRVSETGKILFTGTAVLEGNENCYVQGFFHRTYGIPRSFPVGTSVYSPLSLSSVESNREVGVRFVDGDPGISITDDPDVARILDNGYWEIMTTDLQPVNSRVSVALSAFANSIPADEQAILLQRDGATSSNLGATANADANFAVSERNLTGSIAGVGTTTEVEVTIIDLISPYDDNGQNDQLQIDNINSLKFSNKRLTLLDRYGVFVKEWEGDEVQENINYDFKNVSPGNYIVILEYNDGTKLQRKLQMVSVIKSK
jgi:hypothetical protein